MTTWKTPSIAEDSLDWMEFSGTEAEVSRLGRGAKDIVSKYVAQLEAVYLAELCSTTSPKTTLSRTFLKVEDYKHLVVIVQGRGSGPGTLYQQCGSDGFSFWSPIPLLDKLDYCTQLALMTWHRGNVLGEWINVQVSSSKRLFCWPALYIQGWLFILVSTSNPFCFTPLMSSLPREAEGHIQQEDISQKWHFPLRKWREGVFSLSQESACPVGFSSLCAPSNQKEGLGPSPGQGLQRFPRILVWKWHLGRSWTCLISVMLPFYAIKSANNVSASISTQTGLSIRMVNVSCFRLSFSCVKCIVFPFQEFTASVTFIFDKKGFLIHQAAAFLSGSSPGWHYWMDFSCWRVLLRHAVFCIESKLCSFIRFYFLFRSLH